MSARAEAHCGASELELITKKRSNGESMMITRDLLSINGPATCKNCNTAWKDHADDPCKEFEIADESRVSWHLAVALLAAAIIGIVLMLIADGALLQG
jgi:hypothetical protein